jgi:hypothetical protein
MPKLGDGNESDVRIRPDAAPIDTGGPMVPVGTPVDGCAPAGQQTDLIPPGIQVEVPSGTVRLQYNWADVSEICPKGFDLLSVTKVILQILKLHFTDPNQYFDSRLANFFYNPDPTKTTLRIGTNTQFAPSETSRKPAIIVKRGEQASERVVIGDLSQQSGEDDELNGISRYVRFIRGVHKILVVSTADGEVDMLAQEIWMLFHCLIPKLRTLLPFHDLQTAQLGEVGVLDELGGQFGVPVVIQYAYEMGWAIASGRPIVEQARPSGLVIVSS